MSPKVSEQPTDKRMRNEPSGEAPTVNTMNSQTFARSRVDAVDDRFARVIGMLLVFASGAASGSLYSALFTSFLPSVLFGLFGGSLAGLAFYRLTRN